MKKVITVTVFLPLIMGLLGGCGPKTPEVAAGNGLFSWHSSAVTEERDTLLEAMAALELTVLYQELSRELSQKTVRDFLTAGAQAGVTVYALLGEHEWALEDDAAACCRAIDRIAALNRGVAREARIRGVVLDVEPYLLKQWQEDEAAVMDRYLGMLASAYSHAEAKGLALIVCIPYFYDNKGLDVQLETLIGDCCDGVAVMNYYKGKEAEHLLTEAALTRQYQKPLVTIFELQPPGEHDLTEQNTYYNDGLTAVTKAWREIQAQLSDCALSMALHDWRTLQEVLARE